MDRAFTFRSCVTNSQYSGQFGHTNTNFIKKKDNFIPMINYLLCIKGILLIVLTLDKNIFTGSALYLYNRHSLTSKSNTEFWALIYTNFTFSKYRSFVI